MALVQFSLPSGRAVSLRDLIQKTTHGDVLEGVPSPKHNAMEINSIMRRYGGVGGGVQLIPPPGPYLYEPNADYPFGGPERLPRVTCVAQLDSSAPVHDSELDFSALTLVWFSDALASADAITALAPLIDWDSHAWDFEY